jgi:type I restriction enzyme S subunit
MRKVPSGWRRIELDEIAAVRAGLVDPRNAQFADMLHVGPEHVDAHSGAITGPLLTAKQAGLISGKFLFRKGDIVYSKIRPNLSKIVRPNFSGLCSADMYVLAANPSICDQGFLFHLLHGEQFYKQAVAASMRSGLPKVNRTDLSLICVDLPPLIEQRGITTLLDEADRAIATTETFVAAKRRAKRALMQRLTSDGDTRRLTEVATILFSGVDKKTVPGEHPVHLCNYMDVYANTRIVAGMAFMPATATESEIRRFELQAGDVLFTKDSETADDIAASAYVPADLPGVVCGYHLAIARPHRERIDGGYLAFAMRTPAVLAQFSRAANGVVRFGLNLDAMDKIELCVPALARQRAVAEALAAADEEIDFLTAQADALRRQKRGLMQKLLTGEWRVGEARTREAAE